jgi:hypothetical protein
VVVLVDVGQVEAHFGQFGDSVNLEQDKCTVCAKCAVGSKIVLGAPNRSSVMWIKAKLVWVYLEIVLTSAQERCTICVERTIRLEIILDTPNGTPS